MDVSQGLELYVKGEDEFKQEELWSYDPKYDDSSYALGKHFREG